MKIMSKEMRGKMFKPNKAITKCKNFHKPVRNIHRWKRLICYRSETVIWVLLDNWSSSVKPGSYSIRIRKVNKNVLHCHAYDWQCNTFFVYLADADRVWTRLKNCNCNIQEISKYVLSWNKLSLKFRRIITQLKEDKFENDQNNSDLNNLDLERPVGKKTSGRSNQ